MSSVDRIAYNYVKGRWFEIWHLVVRVRVCSPDMVVRTKTKAIQPKAIEPKLPLPLPHTPPSLLFDQVPSVNVIVNCVML